MKSLWVMVLLHMMPALYAQEAEIVFEPPEDVVILWAKRASLILTVLGVLLVSAILLLRRNRLMESQSKWLLFLGVCVIPVPAAFLSGGIGMEESKEVEFCHSCHLSMNPFVEDMQNPESETLAALHFKNRYIQREQCWSCHSDYGIAGTAEAKMTGLRHIYKYTTNSWEAPVALYGEYSWEICLGCHAQSALFKAPRNDDSAHEGVLEAVLNNEISCGECHGEAHPPREERSTKGGSAE